MASIRKIFSKWKAGVACLGNYSIWLYSFYSFIHFIHLQAMACKRGWPKYEGGLSNELYFSSNISHWASERDLQYWKALYWEFCSRTSLKVTALLTFEWICTSSIFDITTVIWCENYVGVIIHTGTISVFTILKCIYDWLYPSIQCCKVKVESFNNGQRYVSRSTEPMVSPLPIISRPCAVWTSQCP